MASNGTYDVIIIGAGIGGLVCGCYLAKAGMKVLICEQHHKPGGYCTSFKRKGFTFDAAAHSFGSYREGGNMRLILEELGLDKRLKIKKYDPSDIIISPDYKVTFWANINKTIQELQNMFPDEAKNIENFIFYLIRSKPIDFVEIWKKTFSDLLAKYFDNYKLKAILSIPIFGNGGLPPSLISAFTGAKIYTEFILDGGYYPENGSMQSLPDAFVERFKEFGGEIRLSCLVKKIKIRDNKTMGVILEKDGFIPSKFVVSNCDVRQTFDKFLVSGVTSKESLKEIDMMTPSRSVFVLYLGLNGDSQQLQNPGVNVWFLPHYDLEKMYLSVKKHNINCLTGLMMRLSPDKRSFLVFVNTPFKSKKYWYDNKDELSEGLIRRIENIIPELSRYVVYKDAATPATMHRYTLNFKGAAYGWASLPSQLFKQQLRPATSINGLYLVGHWTTRTQGVAGVAYIGRETALLFLRREKYKNLHARLLCKQEKTNI